MKLNKLALLAVAFGLILSCGQSARAQTAATNSTLRRAGQAGAGQGGPLMKILAQLNLSEDQRQKVRPILRESGQKMRALQQEGALTPEEKMGQMKDIMEGIGAKLKTVLTAEQYTKFQELAKEMREKRAASGEGKMKLPGNQLPSDLPTNSVPSPGLGQNTN